MPVLVVRTKVEYPLPAANVHGAKMIPFVSEAIQNYADAFSSPEPDLFAELARETRHAKDRR
jgi:hypothetical protein